MQLLRTRLIVAALAFMGILGAKPLFAEMLASADPPPTVRVAGIVLKWLPQQKALNLRRAEPLIREAAAGGAQIVCTTECFLDGYAMDDETLSVETLRELAEPIPTGPFYQRLAALADELDVYLVAGMLESDGSRLYNTAAIIGPDGSLAGRYHKQRLGEKQVALTAGDQSLVLDIGVGRLGMMICADRRFPEVVRNICARPVDYLICPSGGMFGRQRNDSIVQNRSRETGKYIMFVHPAEFLVTRPNGTIATRKILGDRLAIDERDVGTPRDSSGVFFFDVPLDIPDVDAGELAAHLRKPILPVTQPWKEFQRFVKANIPQFDPPTDWQAWEQAREQLRDQLLSQVVFRGEAAGWREAPGTVKWFDDIEGGADYRVRKVAYEAVPGLWIPALVYEPTSLGDACKVPVIINVNGHDRGGKATPYKQRRCINLARRGILAINVEFLGMGQLRDEDRRNQHNRLVQLDVCGTSGLAPFFLTLQRAVDLALSLPHADPERIGVTGLSGGGWQTIWLTALDPRITLANPVAGYCSMVARIERRNNIGDAEQIPSDFCTLADYTHLTAMVAPRPLLLTYNAEDDCCFLPPDVLPDLLSAARPVFQLAGREAALRIHINQDPGTHNFGRDNREALYRQVGDHFFPDEPNDEVREYDVPASEIRTADELTVPLPPDNLTLHELALDLCQQLPKRPRWPETKAAAEAWQVSLRGKLRNTLRLPTYQVTAPISATTQLAGFQIDRRQLHLDACWTVPAVDFQPSEVSGTVLMISDRGRDTLGGLVQHHLQAGQRVVVLDLLGFGEAQLHMDDGRNDEIAMHLAATIGHRPLGILAGQLLAVAEWLNDRSADQRLTVVAVGPRNSVVALVAAALEPNAIAAVELHHSWGSLKTLVTHNMTAEAAPELFCFGLLELLDIPDMVAMTAPRPVTIYDADSHARWYLAQLRNWYALFGRNFDGWR